MIYSMAKDDPVKGLFVKGGKLHIVKGSEIWSLKAEDGKEPNQWKTAHFASVGTAEEFIEVFSGEILEIVDGGTIFDEERAAVKNAIMTVLLDGLMPAFEYLRKIRASITNSLPELNKRQLYEDFAQALWRAYKDRFPSAVLLLGFKIGFLFKPEAEFERLSGFPRTISRSNRGRSSSHEARARYLAASLACFPQ